MLELLATAAVGTGLAVRAAVQALPLEQRSMRSKSVLKTSTDVALPDVVGEEAAWAELQLLSNELKAELRAIVDMETYHR